MTCPLAGSTRTVSGPRATQTEPAPYAIPVELAARSPRIGTEKRLRDPPVRPVETDESRAVVLGHPGRAAARRDAARGEREPRRREHLVRGEIDARDAALVAEEHPRLVRVERHVPRLARRTGSARRPCAIRRRSGPSSSARSRVAPRARGLRRRRVRTMPADAAAAATAATARAPSASGGAGRLRAATRRAERRRSPRRARRSSRSGRPAPSRALSRRRRRSPRECPAARRSARGGGSFMCA